MTLFSLLISIASFTSAVCVRALEHNAYLTVNVPLFAQTIAANDVARYTLRRMQPRTSYEIPARIHFNWESENTYLDTSAGGARRKLLDLEKVEFTTDSTGSAPGVLFLSYTSGGVHRDGPEHGPTHLIYNIELGEVALGIPVVAFSVILYILAGMTIILVLLPRMHYWLLPRLMKWVQASDKVVCN